MLRLPPRLSMAPAALLIASALFGVAYFIDGLIDGLGVEAPYPLDVVIKAAGVVLLAIHAARRRHAWLAAALALGAIGDVLLALRPAQMSLGIAPMSSTRRARERGRRVHSIAASWSASSRSRSRPSSR